MYTQKQVLSKKLNDIHFINLPSLVKSCYMSRLTRCLHSFITVVSFVLSLTTHIHNISIISPAMPSNKSDGNGQTITQMLTSGLRSEDKERVDMLCECPEMTSQRSCYCSNPSQILDQISPISAKRNSPSFPLPLALHSRLTLQK